MAKKVDTWRAQNQLLADIKRVVEAKGINPVEDEYTIVQPYANSEAIIVSVINQGEKRKVNVQINDATIVLPQREESLDVFKTEEKK
ncbi:2-hydroxyacyl-CoA dehydratase [Limosilactobacillus reuteri]|uniref:2-hydroxyacyl-CoA dehydratase n=1 Tax=Limosilactobacillus reuteri TaxID=1598 RepID=UPI001E386140|nr:2-hydroxyacyl-CoA dehydratase [Limosilactobacillus reuteri]MCC4370566.1 2-hydroxyacyl-CoA dehydratase [Limosilactobacillus reuteri]MCC4371865.1 2-hydroxyacyl-CoA dehydratase [Limosilactobacillus reuteri]MCC4509336.1 2-hydroxyacyl-CoA dehydratase [Limosilactobacillus reuteri]MCC4509379.1 2-hydroxyacyl-CoA dehydratase [Limosilactobacillus reuteri]